MKTRRCEKKKREKNDVNITSREKLSDVIIEFTLFVYGLAYVATVVAFIDVSNN
jgi:hypothetical protein